MSSEDISDNDEEYIYHDDQVSNDNPDTYYNELVQTKGILDLDHDINHVYIELNLCDYFNVDILTLTLNKKILENIICLTHSKNNIINICYKINGTNNITDRNMGILNVFYRYLKNFTMTGIISETTTLLLHELKQIFIKLNRVCINCFNEFQNNLVVSRPTICDRPLCKYSIDTYNLCLDLDYEVSHNNNVLNLLFRLLKELIKRPIKDELDEEFYFKYSETLKDLLGSTVSERLASIKKIIDPLSEITTKTRYNEEPLFSILKWLITSNPAIIINIKDPNIFPELSNTATKKYILQTGLINKEATFQKLKEKYGSFYVFSGSPLQNWHTILRTGLKILSNTKYMTTGAVYGSGIYSSSSFSVAASYSSGYHSSTNLVSLCEVINNPAEFTKHADRNIYVIKNENCITTRFLFEFTNNGTEIDSGIIKKPNYDYRHLAQEPEYFKKATKNDLLTITKGTRCSICYDDLLATESLVSGLNCSKGHYFHEECFKNLIASDINKCPMCSKYFRENIGKGPDGTMSSRIDANLSLAGYPNDNTIVIQYDIPSGTLSNGSHYSGTHRTAYLPNTSKGRQVLSLLREAFDKKLIFQVGQSLTTGQQNIATWGTVHHKTSIDGGPSRHGYPDAGYLDRVLDELKVLGLEPNESGSSRRTSFKQLFGQDQRIY